ncbi:hypothetical protein BC938DRAFT_476858 [Jimgerdemannia flammicorona]|uniref:Uncharacterized protein n=1 Tax=Jimgerdemannia flammicorona TaxID=994334 RepID=A0A433QQ32_9FUNG|nr:hypothetical protein BC938DRAFT_476858 [Jimgerdemannia flammicorona]
MACPATNSGRRSCGLLSVQCRSGLVATGRVRGVFEGYMEKWLRGRKGGHLDWNRASFCVRNSSNQVKLPDIHYIGFGGFRFGTKNDACP